MDPPEDRRMCSSFREWALKEIHDWQGSLVGGTPRQKEVERQIHLINRSGGVIPDTKKSSRTFAGLLSDSAGEDYDPASPDNSRVRSRGCARCADWNSNNANSMTTTNRNPHAEA